MNNLINKIKQIANIFISNIVKNGSEIIIWIFLTVIALGGVTYFVNVPIDYDVNATNEVRDYVINRRTNKIHVVGCSSVSRMSTKNKVFVNDSIINLTQKGYFICNRCKAGIKRKNELVANTLEKIENIIFAEEEISYKPYEDFLTSIDIMGEWYVNHVATYECVLDDNATDNAKEYYNKNNIVKKGNILLYPCDMLKECKGGYNKAGDDCVRYMFSCLNNMDSDFIYLLSKFSKYKWSTINSKSLNNKKNRLQYAMTNLGFEIYDKNSEKVDINHDGYYEFEILPIDEDFKLKKGDILSKDGHIHVYLSDNENFGWGKVNNTYPQHTETHIDYSNNNIICSGEIFTRVYRYIGNN